MLEFFKLKIGNFGDCCSDHCDSFALGKNAEEYDWSAYGIPVTTWIAGSVVEVQWYVGANHAGIHTLALGAKKREICRWLLLPTL